MTNACQRKEMSKHFCKHRAICQKFLKTFWNACFKSTLHYKPQKIKKKTIENNSEHFWNAECEVDHFFSFFFST